jgi:hypothetical protein
MEGENKKQQSVPKIVIHLKRNEGVKELLEKIAQEKANETVRPLL